MTRIILKLILIASLSGCFLIPPYSKISEAPIQALSQDVSVSITYGEQKSVETQHSEGNKVEKNQINAGGKVNITTEGDGKTRP